MGPYGSKHFKTLLLLQIAAESFQISQGQRCPYSYVLLHPESQMSPHFAYNKSTFEIQTCRQAQIYQMTS